MTVHHDCWCGHSVGGESWTASSSSLFCRSRGIQLSFVNFFCLFGGMILYTVVHYSSSTVMVGVGDYNIYYTKLY